MVDDILSSIRGRLGEENYKKLRKIKNKRLYDFVVTYIELMNPRSIFVCSDSDLDRDYIRKRAIERKEEIPLKTPGHTLHFDGYYDQARDKKNTKFLVSKGMDLGPNINQIDREIGEREIHEIMKNIMKGHEMYILFLSLGPTNSEFTIPCVQITDSPYVAHSEQILYRTAYDEFVKLGEEADFFRFVHSEGELDENFVSKNIEKRRIYIDTEENIVYSTNTQYGGNTIGLKKPAFRLAINKGANEGWLTEHMFIMGVSGPNNRITYLLGAYPSMCGKTSTAMVVGERIVGDDIAMIRNIDGEARAVNTEKGIFGIIGGINEKTNPILWKALNSKGEIIFSNVLLTEDGDVFWNGKSEKIPERGRNHSGEWFLGKRDKDGNKIPPSHKNARCTLELTLLENLDPRYNDPDGVPVGGIIYGGRDPDTSVPVEESFDWVHGIITKGASLESETTAATLGKEGVRKFQPMAILDFLSIPIGRYIKHNINFGENLKKKPKIFGVNYFLKDKEGNYLNDILDKKVWLKWMELRIHNDVTGIKTPTGLIPAYEDLKRLFKEVLNKDYSKDDYIEQFTVRVPENLRKIDRIVEIYKDKVPDTPDILFKILEEQKSRLIEAREKFGDYINPFEL